MFALVLLVLVVTAVTVSLITVIRGDRPVSPPRSHHHDLDPFTVRPRGI